MDFDTSSSQPPEQMVWCGEDSVVLHFGGMGVLMVGPYGDWTRCAVWRFKEAVLLGVLGDDAVSK